MSTFISKLLSDGHAVNGSVDTCALLVCVHGFIMYNHNCTAASNVHNIMRGVTLAMSSWNKLKDTSTMA